VKRIKKVMIPCIVLIWILKIITLKDVVTVFPELGDMLLADKFDNITKWEGKAGTFEVSWEYRTYEDYNEYSISNDLVRHILDEEFLEKLG